MHWLRKPRLNNAVATVAVEMVLSLLRVASLSLVMGSYSPFFVIARSTCDEAIQSVRGASGLLRRFAPRNDGFNKSPAPSPARQSWFRGNQNRSLHWPA